MVVKRGAGKKHWAEKARVWAWYGMVSRESGLRDADLDNEFAWTDIARAEGMKEPRPRAFERMRTLARQPRRGLHWQGMREIVVAVDQNPKLKGAQALYDAEIWNLFKEKSPLIRQVDARVKKLLDTHALERVNPLNYQETTDIILKWGRLTVFERSLNLSLHHLSFINRIELAWSLYQQAEDGINWEIRALLLSKVDALLDMFCMRMFPSNRGREIYMLAVNALKDSHADLSADSALVRNREFSNSWMILPKGIAPHLIEERLKPWSKSYIG